MRMMRIRIMKTITNDIPITIIQILTVFTTIIITTSENDDVDALIAILDDIYSNNR
jgi:hypothetical protein